MATHRSSALLLLAFLFALMVLGGCEKAAPPPPQPVVTKPLPPPPPPAPETSQGKLVRVSRSDVTEGTLVNMATGVSRPTQVPAPKGKTFLVLQFEGKASGSFNAFTASWVTDATGKKFRNVHATSSDVRREIHFEILVKAADLVWHDGKKAYQLEPHPVELTETQPAGGAAKP